MDPEKQKQITMYFIEEATEHLQTIESGLLNIQSMLDDPETINEVFRAAHSIKGGAAMLGFTSIQHLAHIFEDHFKVLRENSKILADQELQTLFLAGYDKLQELLDLLQSPFGLSKDAGDAVVKDADPIFAKLKVHLDRLLNSQSSDAQMETVSEFLELPQVSSKSMVATFQADIPVKLRDMLQLFKQPDSPQSRQNLQSICAQLISTGEQFRLTQWSEMMEAVRLVVGNPNNQFRVLAPIVIKEVKNAQELILKQRPQEIGLSAQLRELMPAVAMKRKESNVDDLSDFFDPPVPVKVPVQVEDKATKQWQAFGDRLGWRKQATWQPTAALQFSHTAPEGHLPAPIWLPAWGNSQNSQDDELKAQYAALMAKLSSCNI